MLGVTVGTGNVGAVDCAIVGVADGITTVGLMGCGTGGVVHPIVNMNRLIANPTVNFENKRLNMNSPQRIGDRIGFYHHKINPSWANCALTESNGCAKVFND